MTIMLTPENALDALETLHAEASGGLRRAIHRYVETGETPSAEQRASFRYPELRITFSPDKVVQRSARAYAQLTAPGDYVAAITQPSHFRPYLLEQLGFLQADYGVEINVRVSDSEIPYAYVLDPDDPDFHASSAAELARFFPQPSLSHVGDAVVDGERWTRLDRARPLALFDAPRVDYSLKRIEHYTGAPWRDVQSWILFTNY
jgi:AMP nucleosidase